MGITIESQFKPLATSSPRSPAGFSQGEHQRVGGSTTCELATEYEELGQSAVYVSLFSPIASCNVSARLSSAEESLARFSLRTFFFSGLSVCRSGVGVTLLLYCPSYREDERMMRAGCARVGWYGRVWFVDKREARFCR